MKTPKPLLMMLVLSSCMGKEVNLTLPYSGDKLVVTGTLTAGEKARIGVTRSFPPVGALPEDIEISDAQVTLIRNETDSMALVPKGNGIYESSKPVQAGDSYVLKAEANDLPKIISEAVTVPDSPPKVTYTLETNENPWHNASIPQQLVKVRFPKDAQERFYSVSFVSIYKTVTRSAFWAAADKVNTMSKDCITGISVREGKESNNIDLFSSTCLPANGELIYSVETGIGYDDSLSDKVKIEDAKTVEMRLAAFEEMTFLAAKSLRLTPQENIDFLYMSPGSSFTNIRNGYGLLSAQAMERIILPVKNP